MPSSTWSLSAPMAALFVTVGWLGACKTLYGYPRPLATRCWPCLWPLPGSLLGRYQEHTVPNYASHRGGTAEAVLRSVRTLVGRHRGTQGGKCPHFSFLS